MGLLIMDMKQFFKKDSTVLAGLDKTQKKQSLFVAIALIVLFIASAFTFFNMLYCFSDILGSIVCASADVAIKDLLRSLPIFLSFFMTFWTLLAVHASFRNVSDERRMHSIFKDGIVICAFAGVSIMYVLVGLISGRYSSIVEGGPSALYPLDSLLYSLLFVAIGVFHILYAKKFSAKLPYSVVSRGPIVTKARGIYCVGMTLWTLIAVFGLADFLFGLFIIDFLHGYQFYSVMLLIACFMNPLFLGFWQFYYNELTEENKKKFLLPLAICGLALSVLVVALYFVSLGLNLDAPSNIGFGVLPVAFAASVNMATMIVVVTPLIVSVVALIKGLVARKAKKE